MLDADGDVTVQWLSQVRRSHGLPGATGPRLILGAKGPRGGSECGQEGASASRSPVMASAIRGLRLSPEGAGQDIRATGCLPAKVSTLSLFR